MNEFEFIERLIQSFGKLTQAEFIATGAGDDAAVIDIPVDQQLVISTDTLLPDVHFPGAARGDLVGYRAVAINVSDLAAMGARPLGMTVALTIESLTESWVELFAHGMGVAAHEFGLKILGGNVAHGSLNITVTVHGTIPRGRAMLRSTAQIDDELWVTGTFGATCAYLKQRELPDTPLEALLAKRDTCAVARYFLPHPRVEFAQQLREFAHAAIDVSDGLAAEISRVTNASGLGARVELQRLPTWEGLSVEEVFGPDDSYELLFTASSDSRQRVLEAASVTNTPVVVLGEIKAERGNVFLLGGTQLTARPGFDHFN